MIREPVTVSATGYARTESSSLVTILSFSPVGSVAAGFVQVTGRCVTAGDGLAVGDCVDHTFVVTMDRDGRTTSTSIGVPVVVERAALSDVHVGDFDKPGTITVQTYGPAAPAVVDWTARADIFLLRAQ
jgi:hypothetical protein